MACVEAIQACRVCVEPSLLHPLPHEPRPVLRVSTTARILLAGQAPGLRVHQSGIPYDDPSGDRLRDWLGVDRATFYDERRIAIVPMGFCFPGYSAAKADLPPRRECRATWHDRLFALVPQFEIVVTIGAYAQDYHFRRLGLTRPAGASMTDTVRNWRETMARKPAVIALPHPSWRNNSWLRDNAWFAQDVLPILRAAIATALANGEQV